MKNIYTYLLSAFIALSFNLEALAKSIAIVTNSKSASLKNLSDKDLKKIIGSGGVDGPSFPHNRTCGFPASGCSTPSLLSRENRKLIDCVFQFWSKEREMA